jgi:hypothetical protein
MLSAEGVPYEFQDLQRQELLASTQMRIATGKQASMSPSTNNWRHSARRHEDIDRLTNTDSKARKPGDAIHKEKFETLRERVHSSSERIKKHVNQFIAHAATPESRAPAPVSAVTLGELWKALESLYRVATYLATAFLGDSFPAPLAAPLFDQFAYIDRPLATRKQLKELRRTWEAIDLELQKWTSGDFDAFNNDIQEEYDESPT